MAKVKTMPLGDPDAINRTNLNVEEAYKRGLIHRDYAAHYFRWNFAMKFIKRGMSVLDIGCADGRLCKVLYTNRLKPKVYVGVDVSRPLLEKLMEIKTNFPKRAINLDMRVKDKLPKYIKQKFDIICCFEMVEHIAKQKMNNTLNNIASVMDDRSLLLLSTPNYNGEAAKHHIHEWTEAELRSALERYFIVKKQFGTFASKDDIYPKLRPGERALYDRLNEYYNSSVMSNIFAPLYPQYSRNILWMLRLS